MPRFACALLGTVLLFLAPAASAQRDPGQVIQELQKLAWQRGPGEGAIDGKAQIRIPVGFAFLDEQNTRRFLELMGNPPRGEHYLVAPANLDWFAVFSFDPVGYVRDDGKIDAAALLDALKQGDERGNDERRRLGMAPVYTDGWHVPPRYDADAKRLEWGMRLRDEKGGIHVNYTSRLLGRSGVMSAVLVSSAPALNGDASEFNRLLSGYRFVPGERYAEFKPGDRVAGHGLEALVAGGAAAAAGKPGPFPSPGIFLWLIIGGALMVGLALWKKFFRPRL